MPPHRILLLTDLLPPQFAPRITALLQRLPEGDWQVDVVSEEIRGDHRGSHGSVEQKSSLPAHHLERVRLAPKRGRSLYALADALWQVKSRRLVRHLRQHYDLTEYALIVGMSYRTFPLPAVARLADGATRCDGLSRHRRGVYARGFSASTATTLGAYAQRGLQMVAKTIYQGSYKGAQGSHSYHDSL